MIEDLINKVRTASGPDRSLDAQICEAFNYRGSVPTGRDDKDVEAVGEHIINPGVMVPPALTGSFDELLVFAEAIMPGVHWELHRNRLAPSLFSAQVGVPAHTWLGVNDTPVLAFLEGFLKARAHALGQI